MNEKSLPLLPPSQLFVALKSNEVLLVSKDSRSYTYSYARKLAEAQ